MSTRTSSRLRALATTLTALGVATLAVVGAAPAAHAANPTGSAVEIFIEPGGFTGDPTNAITTGSWGHEGPNRDQGDYISSDLRDSGTAFLNAFGAEDFDNYAVVFAPVSADGSTEEPAVTPGENIGQAYQWFTQIGFGAGFSGTSNPATDEVLKVSTLAEWQDWIGDGKPDQLASSNDLVMHDALRAGNPVSAHPKGKSILNRWASGQQLSLIVVRTTGTTDAATGLPILAPAANGHANAAWLNFTTSLDPHIGDATHPNIATSGSYTVTSAVTTPTVTLGDTWSGDTGTLTATIGGPSGTLTDASGTVQFSALPDNANTGTYTPVGGPVTVSNGVASTSVTGLSAGGFRKYKATYTPDSDASAKYAGAESNPRTVTPQATATTTTLAVTGTRTAGSKQTLTATLSPSAATGTVQFKDHSTLLGSVAVASGHAVKQVALAAGSHSLTATYVPSGAYAASASAAQAVTVAKARPTITATVSPSAVKAGSRPKLVVTVKAAGLVPAGKVTVTVRSPKGSAKVSATLKSGKATITLPKAVKGKQRLTISYGGSASLLTASKSASYTAR